MTAPYPDDRAYVRDALARLDCRLRIEVDRFEGPIDEFGALYVSEAEVRDLLSPESTDGARKRDHGERQRLERYSRELRGRRRATAEAGEPLRIDRLVDRFGLDQPVRDTDDGARYEAEDGLRCGADVARHVLVLALAPDVDETYATVYAYLQDDATRRRPTVGFLLGLLDSDRDQLADRALFTPGSPFVDADLLRLADDGPLPEREVRVDRRIASYLLGEDAADPQLSDIVTVTDPSVDLGHLDVSADHREALAGLTRNGPGTDPLMVAMHGPPGTDIDDRVAALCAEQGESLLRLDTEQVPPDQLRVVLDRLRREARLRHAAVHVADVLDGEGVAEAAIETLDDSPGSVYLSGETAPSTVIRTAATRHELIPVHVAPAGYDARSRYWAERDDLPDGVDPATIASTFRLSRGAIDDAMEMASARARADGHSVSPSHVYEACRAQSSEELSSLATKVDPSYDWDDIVLPDDTEAQLREVATRLTNRGTVYTDWGFGEQASLGTGLVAMFSGPSGTGKTMAAEVVAGQAGLHLYKIDLAAVVSKYVGETEANLGRVFDEAANSDAILLFDEADALFGERSEVSDAHDRYANVEVDYLLQRVEEHDGAVILTTNLQSNIDDAFLRRIHLAVEFPLPDREHRAEIWRRVFPSDAPVGDLDYDLLGRLELTGGNIRNIALSAAFYAAEEGSAIGMEAVVRAIKRECQKTGMPIQPAQFGEYRDVIDGP